MRSTRRTWNARAPTCWIPSGLWESSSIPRALSTMSRVSPGRALLPRWAISPTRRIPLSRRPPSRRIRTKQSPRPAAKRRVPPQPDKNSTPPSAGFSRTKAAFLFGSAEAGGLSGILGARSMPGRWHFFRRWHTAQRASVQRQDSPLYGQYRPKTNTPAAQTRPCGGGVFMYGNRTDQTSS